VVTTFDDVVRQTIALLDKAEKRVYFTSKYFDVRVVEKILDLLESGVEMYFITPRGKSVKDISKMILSMMFNPGMVKNFYKFLNSSDINYRTVESLPYTFIIVDHKFSMFEVAKPFEKQFLMAFFFEDDILSEKLVESFYILWDAGESVTRQLDKR